MVTRSPFAFATGARSPRGARRHLGYRPARWLIWPLVAGVLGSFCPGEPTEVIPPCGEIGSIQVAPTELSVDPGHTSDVSGQGYNDCFEPPDTIGDPINTSGWVWGSKDAAVATVEALPNDATKARISGVSEGTATIVADANPPAHPLSHFRDTVYVTVKPLGSLTVTPSAASLMVGESVTLTAHPKDQGGSDVTVPVTWTSADPTVVSVTSTTQTTASATAVGAGTSQVTAQVGSVSADVPVAVAGPGGADPWSVVYYSSVNDYRRVSFASSGTGMALALNGAVVRSTDGGLSWTEATPIDHAMYGDGLDIAVPHTDTAYVLAGGSTILRSVASENSGAWTVPGATMTTGLTALYFPDGTNGWAVGNNGTILHTDDAGATWTPQVSNTTQALQAVFFYGTQFGAAVGNAGAIVSTTDGGVTPWSATPVPNTNSLSDVWLASATIGVAIGRSSGGLPMVVRTDDGGASWPEVTTNLPMSTGFIPAGIALPTSLVATLVEDEPDGPGIYRSVDGGMSWTREQFTTPRPQRDVFMFNADEGVSVGTGVILHRP